MKTIITRLFLNLILVTGFFSVSEAQTIYYYDFRNTLTEESGTGPDLNVLGTGAFMNEGLTELSCIPRPVYGFTQNSGVQFDNGLAGNFIGTTYSIEMYFKFLSDGLFKRIIDFKNQTSDSGLYCTTTILNFYDGLTVNTTAFVANQYVHLVMTRDGATNEVILYIDGAFGGSFIDNGGLALTDTSNVINFFQDDLVFGGESRPGRIALLKLYDNVIDAATVNNNYNNLQQTSGSLAFTSDVPAACLNGNIFNFTNTSQNSGAITYNWEFGDGDVAAGTNASHSYITSGLFDVLLIADNGAGCIDTTSLQVEVYNAAPVDLGADIAICDGDSVLLDAGSGFTSYLWSTGSPDQSVSVAAAGSYSVEVTDLTGCSGMDTIEVIVVAYPVVDIGPDVNICFGQTVTLNATPGEASYLWSTGDTTESIVASTAGIYSVAVANATGCSTSDTMVLSVNSEIIISLGADTTFCEGNTVTLDAGSGFQAYLWSDGTLSQTFDVTISGTYAVTVTDLFSCTATDSIDIIVNPIPVPFLGTDTTFCGGTAIILDPGSFAGYLWSNSTQNPTLTVNAAGVYSVTVTDANGCTAIDEILLIATPAISLGPDQVLCSGIVTTLDAGAGLSTYLWNDGTSLQTLDVTTSGIYTVTVTDGNGCINQDEVEVTFSSVPVIDLGADFDICDGEIAILDPGAGYPSYLWSDGSTDPVLLVTANGTYAVTVSSAANCSATDSITINVLSAPVIDLGADTSLCDSGIVTLDAGAGFAAYLWSDGSFAQTLDVNQTGLYGVTVTNINGCETSDSILITFEGPPFLELGPDISICSGTASVLDAGPGMANYLWNDGTNSQMLLVFAAGVYSVTITSNAGCISQDSITVAVLNSPVIFIGPDTTLCNGAQLVLDAGFGFTNYLWNDGTFLPTLVVTASGLYSVVVTDTNSCNGTDEIEIFYHAPVPVPVITQNVNTLTSSSPSGNQWYSVPSTIIPGATGQDFTPTQDGTYYVVVTDSNGCESVPSANIVFVIDGISESSDAVISIIPNPASDLVTISATGWTTATLQLEVIDVLGKILHQELISSAPHKLDVSTFVEGIYFIRLTSENHAAMSRLVITR